MASKTGKETSYMPMLEEKVLTDVVVVCGENRIDCHKIILARHSEVFRSMLTGEGARENNGVIQIEAFAPDVIKSVIDFIYGGNVAENCLTWELYEAAETYELPGLKSLCLVSLRRNVSVDNCCRMLEASFKHGLDDVFEHTMKFVKKNKSKVAKSDGWKGITEGNPLLGKINLHLM